MVKQRIADSSDVALDQRIKHTAAAVRAMGKSRLYC